MIVPFNKNTSAEVHNTPPAVPEQFLLAAMGQAHAEGKFHVYDPRVAQQFDAAKKSQQQFDATVSKNGLATEEEKDYYGDSQTEKDLTRQEREGRATAGGLKYREKQMEDAEKNSTDSNVEDVEDKELGRWKRKEQDL